MNKSLHRVLFLLTNTIMPAAEKPYEIISNSSMKISPLEMSQLETWKQITGAIADDHLRNFNKHISTSVINRTVLKATWIENGQKYIDTHTLLEYIIALEGTENRAQMLTTLIQKGAYTRSTYTVALPLENYCVDHHPPIFYAIIKGNAKAFNALWQADNKVPFDSIISQWAPEQEVKEEDFVLLEEEPSSESLDTVLQEYYSPSNPRTCKTSLSEDDFIIIDSVDEQTNHRKKNIRDFLILLKDRAENPQKYSKDLPIKTFEGKTWAIPMSYIIQDMINITEDRSSERSLLLSSLSSLSSLFFWK